MYLRAQEGGVPTLDGLVFMIDASQALPARGQAGPTDGPWQRGAEWQRVCKGRSWEAHTFTWLGCRLLAV